MTPEQQREQDRLLKEGTGWDCTEFARDIEGADSEALERRVLAIGDEFDCYVFARDVRGADQ